MSEIPAQAHQTDVPRETWHDALWHSSPPGSIYDYIKVASFSIGPDGLIDQWSLRAEELFGLGASQVVGRDPVDAFMPPELRPDAHRKVAEILDGKEWTGLIPFRIPGGNGAHGVAEIYVMPTQTETAERAALCVVVDVRALRRIESDLAASQAIFGQSPFGFLLFGTDLTVQRANRRFATVFGGAVEEHRGRTVHDYLPAHEADRMTEALRRVLDTGESVTDLRITGATPAVGRTATGPSTSTASTAAAAAPSVSPGSAPTSPAATSPPGRPPGSGATWPSSTRPGTASATRSTWRPPPANSSTSPSPASATWPPSTSIRACCSATTTGPPARRARACPACPARARPARPRPPCAGWPSPPPSPTPRCRDPAHWSP